MPKPFNIFSRKKPTRRFNDYYTDWTKTLTDHLLPLLRQSLSSASSAAVLSSNVDRVLRHLVSYYETLDLAADSDTIPYLLFPSWRNSLETPFLFLGDLHPYLFTNLLRSFIDRENNDSGEEIEPDFHLGLDRIEEKPWKIEMAWKDPSDELVTRIDQIECAMRLMVPVLVDRMRKAQGRFMGRVAENWVSSSMSSSSSQEAGKKKKTGVAVVEEAAKEEMEEMASIFVDANRLRKSIIMDIVGASSDHQAALYLEGLSQFLVGFKDQSLLHEFELCPLLISNKVGALVSGDGLK
ncbi:PREDICTED: protein INAPERTURATE POLLEN1 [Tarenaya hassleriana]|uniref:protein INAPERTURATE POLLEN1 n=1 Tax=Tarenaya hassleriana TaxID=28532 RepID=UPI00053C734D|nr:PREDICTED: protein INAPERTURATE POLLEN1 [Tarenaya hassleriana]